MSKQKFLIIGALVLLFISAILILTNQLVLAQALQSPDAKTTEKATFQAEMQSANFSISWDVIGQGGGVTDSTHFIVTGTIGQPATGNTSSTSFDTHAGFWQNFIRMVFLPLITR